MENLLVRRGDRTITVAVPPCDARRGGPCAAAWTAWGNLVPARGHARRSPVAQLAEHATVNRRVIGSSPIGGALTRAFARCRRSKGSPAHTKPTLLRPRACRNPLRSWSAWHLR